MEGCSSTSAETFKHYEPSPAQHHKRYHVFLSFRGTDVRNTFVDHLFKSLSTAGFHVFLDTERLEKGKNIEVSLEEAIRNSTVFIPIFSTNYASSSWCLNELSLLWTSKSTCTETTIIPLFYNVKPSDVRYPEKEKTPYAQAFQEHRKKERHSKEDIDAWKEALHQVSLLSGWSLAETPAGNEDQLLKLVVMDLQKVLPINDLYVAKHPVGLTDRMEEVTTWLEMNSDRCHVLFVGIWGMGGLGKTTLAKAVYNNIRCKFEASCFVPDVRASTEGSVKGLLKLQKQILRELAKVDKSTLKMLNSVPNAKIQMKSLLRSIKALVVLDDVDDQEQLDALVGDDFSGCWFDAGSRIIITTRDHQIWERHHAHVKEYNMRGLDRKEGLKLFSWYAFMRPGPAEGHQDITEKIVDACQGLPLSLEVVGASLYGKSLEIWGEAVTNLVKNHKRVYNTLKISYDALSDQEKRMFLDIACFFLGPLFLHKTIYDSEFYVKLWEGLDFSAPRTCLRNLEMKSLIRINYDRYHYGSGYHYSGYNYNLYYSIFWMHDNLRDLGRQIVEEASPSNPAERTRFWRPKELVTAMAQTQRMPNVEGLVLDFGQAEEGLHQKYCSRYQWALMPNLKFMFIRDLCQEGRTNLPPNLIFLGLLNCRFEEDESASETEPIPLCLLKTIGGLRSLRFLHMNGTSIYHLPNEVGELFNLEELYMYNCKLRELPQSFANLSKLKVLDISHNHKMSFPANFHLPSNLTDLQLNNCRNLQKMTSISHLKRLETLNLSWCTGLTELPSLDSMHSLIELTLVGCEELKALPALPDALSRLNLYGCRKLQSSVQHFSSEKIGDPRSLWVQRSHRIAVVGLHAFFNRARTRGL